MDRADGGGRKRIVGLAKWDFPRSPYSTATGPSINAKIERLTTTWKTPLASRRCAVALDGYYEWTGPREARQPHYLHSDGLLMAAGLWAQVEGEKRPRFVIVTREARDASGEVHDRMPAFLTPDLLEEWLDPRSFTPPNRQKAVVDEHLQRKESALQGLYSSSEEIASTITEFLVSPKVNNVKKAEPSDATLIEPI